MTAKQDGALARAWLDNVFPLCDAYERQKFEANFDRAMKGEELVDDWNAACLSGAGEAYKAQYVLCEMVKDAVERGAPLPAPEEPTGALRRYASKFGEGSAAAKVLFDAAEKLGWDCAAFEDFDVEPAAFERACRFALVALAVQEREERKVALMRRGQLSASEETFFDTKENALGVALYCVNRVAFCRSLNIGIASNYNAPLRFGELSSLYRRLYRLGGVAK